jgi:hypothetical protein
MCQQNGLTGSCSGHGGMQETRYLKTMEKKNHVKMEASSLQNVSIHMITGLVIKKDKE